MGCAAVEAVARPAFFVRCEREERKEKKRNETGTLVFFFSPYRAGYKGKHDGVLSLDANLWVVLE